MLHQRLFQIMHHSRLMYILVKVIFLYLVSPTGTTDTLCITGAYLNKSLILLLNSSLSLRFLHKTIWPFIVIPASYSMSIFFNKSPANLLKAFLEVLFYKQLYCSCGNIVLLNSDFVDERSCWKNANRNRKITFTRIYISRL